MLRWFPACHALFTLASCLPLVWLASQGAGADEPPQFETEIRPILREYCFDCHGATEEVEGGLDLRLVRWMLSGGDSGAAVVAGDPAASLMLMRVRDGDMPPGEARVSTDKIAVLERWIRHGAPTLRAEPQQIGPGIPITEEERNYWAYQPLDCPPLPAERPPGEIRTPVDALLAAAMPPGLSFSPDADRFTLIQRVFYNLLGLPPSREQLEYWLHLQSPDWYEQLLEALLSSPHYGERWARHWLDAAGYADSDGYTLADPERQWAWRYRDYVVRALNEDKGWDQFIIEQLAGDELAGPKAGDWSERQIELLTATGFLRMAADGTGSGDDSPEARNKTIADTLQIVCSALLASSVHCAQCHDHRYDPISHRDYFALRSVFEPALDWQAWKTPAQRLVSLYTAEDRAQAAAIESQVQQVAAERAAKQAEFMQQAAEQELMKFDEPLRSHLRTAYETPADKRSAEQIALLDSHPSLKISAGVLYQYLPKAAEELKGYDQKMSEMRAGKPSEQFVHALVEPPDHAPLTHLFHRGDFNQPRQVVQPGALTVTAAEGAELSFAADDSSLPTTGRRLAFARWLTGGSNPLTPRAIVNRVWMHHFGRGIVATPGDFGRLGGAPSHPELLDWLASDFVSHGWSLKHLHRTILSSTAWRQTSVSEPARQALDADNYFYWRKPLQRVDAEILRDTILAVAGNLDLQPGGPPVPIAEDETGQVRVDAEQPRRSIYVRVRRSQPVQTLQTFDAPVMSVNCDVRTVTTVAPQSLMMLNGQFVLEQAAQVAKLVRNQAVCQSLADGQCGQATDTTWMPSLPAPRWHYGSGSVDEAAGGVVEFRPLPHFTGTQWQGGPKLPDPQWGWVLLRAEGGHPGDRQHPAIRRWIAPLDGQISLSGSLQHGSENGDGVRGRVFAGGGLRGTWHAANTTVATEISPFAVQAGDAVDIVSDCVQQETSDSFTWTVKIRLTPEHGPGEDYDSASEFSGPAEDLSRLPGQIIAAWKQILSRSPNEQELQLALAFAGDQLSLMAKEQQGTPAGRSPGEQVLVNVCQMLLSCNEFLYIE